jgi:hypothetical protein
MPADPIETTERQDNHPAVWAGIEAMVCNCYPGGWTPETYEGPKQDCPVHGEPAAIVAAVAPAVLRAFAARMRDLAGVSDGPAQRPSTGYVTAAVRADAWAAEIDATSPTGDTE